MSDTISKPAESSAADALMQRIEHRSAVTGIVGLGYIGLPLAYTLHQGGLPVVGFDTDRDKLSMLANGRNYLEHLGTELVATLSGSERFEVTADFSRMAECDVIIVCVPTPLGPHREPDMSYVLATATVIGRSLRRGQLICLESTTYPCTTRDEFLPAILESAGDGLVPGQDFFVAFSPEREDPGRSSHVTRTIPKLVGGLDDCSTTLAAALYRTGIDQVVAVASVEIAEAAKLLENIFRAVNIALVNEMKVILGAMNIDIWQVIRAAGTKPFGFMPFYPGPGLGGHCIPIDPFYLTWKAKEVGKPTRLIELAGEINTTMPAWVVQQVMLSLNDLGKPVKGSKVLVLGLAYKPDVADSRESPAFELIEQLLELGAHVDYSDPHLPVAPKVRKHDLQMLSVTLTPDVLRTFDCVLVATNHSAFDWAMIAKHARLVVDTRDALRAFEAEMGPRLKRA